LSAAPTVEHLRPVAAAIVVRDAGKADLPRIVEIYNTAIASRVATAQLQPINLEQAAGWLSEHSPGRFPLWLLEIDGQIAGYLSFKAFLPRAAYRATAELSVYVDERFRRRGVAKKLLQGAIARGPALGINALVALVFGHNAPSLRLFEQVRFERWGLLPRVARVDGIARDLVILGRHCDGAW
jgi:L-amino acid N-acyltransferase YncA